MMHRRLRTPAAIAASMASTASAHDGHRASGPHSHLTDALGLLGVILVIGLALWLRRK